MEILLLALALILGTIIVFIRGKLVRLRRAELIRDYPFPPGLYDKLRAKHPHLSLKDCQLVGHALRHFFLAYLKSGGRFIGMPSQCVDDLWHEFILYTREYAHFCRHAFGEFLHHTPSAAFSESQRNDEGLKRVFWHACREEHINPFQPSRLPLLFAVDRKLAINGGFVYMLSAFGDEAEAAKLAADGVKVHFADDLRPPKKKDGPPGTYSCGAGTHGCGGGGSSGCSSGGCGGGGCGGGS